MAYTPLNYNQINALAGTTHPSSVKSFNNKTYEFWERSLFQRACSVLDFTVPEDWEGNVKDFLLYCLFKFGFVAVFDDASYGTVFQPCSLSGYNLYYQPTNAIISNPVFNGSKDLVIGRDCELIKLTPDYMGIWDVISYYAEKLSTLDNAINMSLINNKFAFMVGARNKTAGEALKKMLDKVNQGEPAVIYDMRLLNDPTDKAEPWQFLERKDLKSSYLTTDQLQDFQTLIHNFDAEVGIPTLNSEKKERLVTDEAQTKTIDGVSRSLVWFDTLESSIQKCKALFYGLDLSVKRRFDGLDNSEPLSNKEEGEPLE